MAITRIPGYVVDSASSFEFANASVTGNVVATSVKTNNLLYSNGSPYVFTTNAAGTNTQVQFNDANSFAGSANFTFNKTSNTLSVTNITGNGFGLTSISGSNVTGTVANATYATSAGSATTATAAGTVTTAAQPNITSVGTLTSLNVTGNITSGNISGGNAVAANYFVGNGSLLTGLSATTATTAGTVTTAAQPNITSIGTLTSLGVSGNATITGNLTVSGSTIYANVTTLNITDPIIEQGGNPNGTPLSTNDGKDRGSLLHYYTTIPVDAFMGWDNSNAEFSFGSNVSILNDVITFNQLGNVRASYFLGNGSALTSITGANVTGTVANAAYATTAGSATTAGTVTTAAQPNITSVGTLTSITSNGTINFTGSSNVSLGNVSNLHISGGNANFVLKTDGAGNLSWAAQSTNGNIGTFAVAVDTFTGNGVQTAYALSTAPVDENYTFVSLGGTFQPKTTYSVSGSVLTFSSPPPSNTVVEVTTFTSTSGVPGYSEVTANATLVANNKYIVNTSTSSITLMLPAPPTLGQEVTIIDGTGNASIRNITVNGNGSNIQGVTGNMIVSADRAAFTLVYYNTAQGWIYTRDGY